jgi:hypothetical protein
MWFTIAKWGGGILGGLALAWIVYAGLIRPTTHPNPSTSQKADVITNVNYYITPHPVFGCAGIRVYNAPKNETAE